MHSSPHYTRRQWVLQVRTYTRNITIHAQYESASETGYLTAEKEKLEKLGGGGPNRLSVL